MFHALSLLVLTGLSWVPTGAIVGFIGRRGFNLFFFQLICSVIGFLIGGVIGLVSPATLLPPAGIPASTWTGVIAGCLAFGFFNYFMTFFMGRAMERGPNAIVWAIIQSGLIYPFLMGWLVFGTPMSLSRAIGIVFILASIVLYAVRGGTGAAAVKGGAGDGGKCGGSVAAWLVPSLLGMLFCGTNQCGGNLTSYLPRGQEFPSYFRAMLTSAGGLAGCALQLVMDGVRRRLPRRPGLRELAWLVLFALALTVGTYPVTAFLLYPGLDRLQSLGAGAMAYPVMVASCIIGFFPYGMLVLRERFNPIQLFGAVVGVAGIILGCL